jgi:hypothetical protein
MSANYSAISHLGRPHRMDYLTFHLLLLSLLRSLEHHQAPRALLSSTISRQFQLGSPLRMVHRLPNLTTAATVIMAHSKLSRTLPVPLHLRVCFLPAARSKTLRGFRIVRTTRTSGHLRREQQCCKNHRCVGRIHPVRLLLCRSPRSEEASSVHLPAF